MIHEIGLGAGRLLVDVYCSNGPMTRKDDEEGEEKTEEEEAQGEGGGEGGRGVWLTEAAKMDGRPPVLSC